MKCKGRKQFVPTQFTQMSIRAAGAALGDHFILYQADAELINARLLELSSIINTLQARADRVSLQLRPFTDAQASPVFEIRNAAGTAISVSVLRDGKMGLQALADDTTLLIAPFSDTQVNDIFRITDLAGTFNLLRVRGDGTLEVGSGILADGGGMKQRRVAYGALAAGASAIVTITWTTAFLNTNYTVLLTTLDATAGARVYANINAQRANGIDVAVSCTGGVGSGGGTLHVVAIHD
jgi:hypothetical protein